MNRERALVQDWFRRSGLGNGDRLPPERELAAELRLPRGALRKVLAELVENGLLSRHVGRGTFMLGGVPGLPAGSDFASGGEALDMSPRFVLEARLSLEPELAWRAAREGTPRLFAAVAAAERAAVGAAQRGLLDAADEAFHRAVAAACGNPLLLELAETALRAQRSVAWGSLRERAVAGSADDALRGHAEILAALLDRDSAAAHAAAARHVRVEAAILLGGAL